MHHHWGCTLIYRPLSYPFRSLPSLYLFIQELVKDSSIPEKHKIVLEEEETAIRLAIAKNLALSIIKEGDNGSHLVN